jgi:hypothetical protein
MLPRTFLVLKAILGICALQARADWVEYNLPGTPFVVLLQGETTANAGGTLSLRHKLGTLHFSLREVELHKAPSIPQQFRKRLAKAIANKKAEEIMAAGEWGLHHGQLAGFYEAVDATLNVDPNFPEALRIRDLRVKMDVDLGSYEKQEKELRELVRRSSMKIAVSPHFILLHDTPDKPAEKHKKPRAQERLDLLEQVYESFFLKFYSKGVALEIPKERLKVCLFQNHRDYLTFATRLSPDLQSAAGFWDPANNTSVFYDSGTTERFKVLTRMAKEFQEAKKDAQKIRGLGAADIVRLADTLTLMVEIDKENQDITVVSHEATHQLAGNTGLLPRWVMIPSWVHEGLASYFEAPGDAAWAGIGAVNEERISLYRILESDKEHSNIDFIVGDQIFDYAASHGAVLHGYGQAWALTHFLMERHFDKFMEFYRRLGEMPPDCTLTAPILTELFDEVFGKDRVALDADWRDYMNSLKTDIELVLGEDA